MNTLKTIARLAGEKILEVYGKEDFQVDHKDDSSPLTQADTLANNIICDGLEKMDPSIPIISEENKLVDYEVRKAYERFWLVDPLDGTKEFVNRNGEFTVNIALIENQRVISSVVYVPILDEMYYATKGKGAYLEKDGKTLRLNCCPYHNEESYLQIICSRSHLNEETSRFVSKYPKHQKIAKGSSLKFLILAAGDAHIYPRLAPTMEWDTAAAQIILEEAGGSVIDWETKEPLKYNKNSLRNPYFVAYAKQITTD